MIAEGELSRRGRPLDDALGRGRLPMDAPARRQAWAVEGGGSRMQGRLRMRPPPPAPFSIAPERGHAMPRVAAPPPRLALALALALARRRAVRIRPLAAGRRRARSVFITAVPTRPVPS